MAALEQVGDERCYAICQRSLGSLALDRGDFDEAMHWLGASLDALAEQDERSLAVALADIASVHAAQGRLDLAASLANAARTLARRSGLPLSAAEQARIDRAALYAARPTSRSTATRCSRLRAASSPRRAGVRGSGVRRRSS